MYCSLKAHSSQLKMILTWCSPAQPLIMIKYRKIYCENITIYFAISPSPIWCTVYPYCAIIRLAKQLVWYGQCEASWYIFHRTCIHTTFKLICQACMCVQRSRCELADGLKDVGRCCCGRNRVSCPSVHRLPRTHKQQTLTTLQGESDYTVTQTIHVRPKKTQ